jgi:hypothetical protein
MILFVPYMILCVPYMILCVPYMILCVPYMILLLAQRDSGRESERKIPVQLNAFNRDVSACSLWSREGLGGLP